MEIEGGFLSQLMLGIFEMLNEIRQESLRALIGSVLVESATTRTARKQREMCNTQKRLSISRVRRCRRRFQSYIAEENNLG